MRNVHEYDGKIHMKMDKVFAEDEMERIRNDAEFLEKMPQCARFMAHQIFTDNGEKNIDQTNHHADAKQLFVAVVHKISQLPEEDKILFIQLLEEQLEDMKNLGPCPQGRTIRLWQLFQSLSL